MQKWMQKSNRWCFNIDWNTLSLLSWRPFYCYQRTFLIASVISDDRLLQNMNFPGSKKVSFRFLALIIPHSYSMTTENINLGYLAVEQYVIRIETTLDEEILVNIFKPSIFVRSLTNLKNLRWSINPYTKFDLHSVFNLSRTYRISTTT